MKKKVFIILDLIIQVVLTIIIVYISIQRGEFLEYDAFVWFIVFGFWQLIAALIKAYHYKMNLKLYLVMVRNFSITLGATFFLGFILSRLYISGIVIVLILLNIMPILE